MTFVLPDDPPSEELTDHGDATRSSDTDAAMPDRALAHVRAEFHQGSLPSPEALRTYEDVLPGAAERVFSLAERNLGLTERQLIAEECRQDQIHRCAYRHRHGRWQWTGLEAWERETRTLTGCLSRRRLR